MSGKIIFDSNKKLSLIEHQEIMFRLMREFHEYCEKKNLRYYLTGGTLLGAVRHKGIIPWDDDVDVVMPRPDYEKLISEKYISEISQIVTYRFSHGYNHPFVHANITDVNTIMVERQVSKQTNKGVFIDVFPLDGLPTDAKKRKRHMSRLMFWQTVLSIGINKSPGFGSLKSAIKSIFKWILMPFSNEKIAKKIDCMASKYMYDDCDYVAHSIALFKKPERFVTPKQEYEGYVLLDFEDSKFRAPVAYEDILKRSYGNYMELPPEEQRKGHHGIEIYYRDGVTN